MISNPGLVLSRVSAAPPRRAGAAGRRGGETWGTRDMMGSWIGEPMFRDALLAVIAFALAAAPVNLSATSVEKVMNSHVVVTEETLARGESATFAGNRPSMFVFMTDGVAEIKSGDVKAAKQNIRRGQLIYKAAFRQIVKNEGHSELRFAHIVFLNKPNHETWGMTGLSPEYKLLLENEHARAYDIKIPVQTFEPLHTHRDRVVVCLDGAELEHILPNGEHQPSTLKAGEIGWRPGVTHIGHNMGHTDLWVIAIEPK